MLNIDHHHDNTRFGDVNLVAPKASCTAEIVYDIAHLLGVPIDAEMAMPLYVGLITDTGKFMYENTNAHTHRVAAELIDAGVERRRHLPAALRARADREAAAGRAGAGRDPDATAAGASRSATSPPRTTPRPAPARR